MVQHLLTTSFREDAVGRSHLSEEDAKNILAASLRTFIYSSQLLLENSCSIYQTPPRK